MNYLVVDDDVALRKVLAGSPTAIYLDSDRQSSIAQGFLTPEVSGFVIGPMATDPLSVAQRIARIDEQLAVLIIPYKDAQSRIRRQRLFTPFLGADVRILEEHGAESLTTEVQLACRRTVARRKHRAKLVETVQPEPAIWRPEANAVLDTLLNQAPIGLAVLDSKRRIRAWNRYLERMTGVAAAEAVGHSPLDVPHSAAVHPLMRVIVESVDPGSNCEIQLQGPEHDSEPTSLLISQCSLQGRPTSAGSLVMVQDVSERVKAERQRLETERLHADAQRLESLGVLSGGIAHDFNNLLLAILGNAELGLLQAATADPVSTHLNEIVAATRQASELTRQMLAYAGQTSVETKVRDLNTIIPETCNLLKASINKNARLLISLHAEALPVEMDLAQIRQLLMNLVTNGSDAIGENQGEIHISTDICDIEANRLGIQPGADLAPGRYAKLTVRDTGCGMQEETRRRIFEPFFTTKNLGRGLGLASVAGTVGLHHGELSVESEVGVGTCFEVLLPLADSTQATEAKVDVGHLARANAGQRVLIVDDELRVLDYAAEALRSLGYEVETAEDGSSGLQKVLTGMRVDAVLLDYSMPGLTGAQVMRELQTRGFRVPIVLCSGYADFDDSALREFTNLRSILAKPYSLHDLASCLKDAIESAE
jgi:PAS domain S-box-containing protein